jgi:hypothetical protein
MARSLLPAVLLLILAPPVTHAARWSPRRPITFSQRIEEASTVAFAQWMGTSGTADKPVGRYHVLYVAKTSKKVAVDQEVEIPGNYSHAAGEVVMLTRNVADWNDIWDPPITMSRSCYDYAILAPDPDEEERGRIRYFIRHLASRDAQILVDVFLEMEYTSFDNISAAAEIIPRDIVRARLRDDKTNPAQIGFYGMLLGYCGDKTDEQLLRQMVSNVARENEPSRVGICRLIVGYLALTGDTGLDWMDSIRIKNSDARFGETYAALWAVRFLWVHADGRLSRARLRQSVESLLDHPDLSDLAVTTLRRWEDWSQHDRFIQLFHRLGDKQPWTKTALVEYLVASTLVPPEIQADHREGFFKAAALIDLLAMTDPKLVARARLYAIRFTCAAADSPDGPVDPIIQKRRDRTLKRLEEIGAIVFRSDSQGPVTEVNANRTKILDNDLRGLADFHQMTDLSLEETAISDDGLRQLGDAVALVWLNLYRTKISDRGLRHVAKLKQLRFLPIGETKVTDQGLLHLKEMKQLTYLGLRGNSVTDRGVEHLGELTKLTGLYLGGTKVTDDGLKPLQKMTSLKKLWLNDTAITDKSIPLLATLKSLQELHVEDTKISTAGVVTLRRRLPACEILSAKGSGNR